MKVLIVDDEAPGRKNMRRLVATYSDIRIVGEASCVDEALRIVQTESPDLIFLDIQLRGETGFDLLGRIPDPAPRIVFVTAFNHYAVRAFECNAMDYLLKPVEPERLALTLRRIRESQPPPTTQPTGDDRVLLKSDGEMRWIFWRDILSIQAEGNYTQLSLRENEQVMVYRTLKAWTEQMPEGFLQIHRRHLVRITEIERVIPGPGNSKQAFLTSGEILDVGRSFWPDLKSKLVDASAYRNQIRVPAKSP